MSNHNKKAMELVVDGKQMEKIDDYIGRVFHNETFVEMLLRLIDEKSLSDSEVYKRANLECVSKFIFSSIMQEVCGCRLDAQNPNTCLHASRNGWQRGETLSA